ncbi:MAG: RNA polymerase sigma factor [Chloroflexota bacterium]
MDRILVDRAMAGDREAFNELAGLSVGRLYGIAQLILRDPDRAWDATQEALVASWRDLSALRDPDRFDAWLYRILVRSCHREARRVRQRRTVEVRELPFAASSGPDEVASMFDRDELERAFRRLGVEERAIVVLHHVEGFPLREIADILGLPIGTVKSRLHRGIQTVRAALDADARVVSIDGERIA